MPYSRKAYITKDLKWPKEAIGGAYSQPSIPETTPSPTRVQAWHGAPMAAILT